MLGGVTYRHVKWLRNHEQRQRKVGRPSEGCPCYYVHCLTCKSSLALNGRNQNNMPVSFVCRRTSWLQSCFGMRGEEKQQVNGKRRNIHTRGSRKVTSSESASLRHLLPQTWTPKLNKHTNKRRDLFKNAIFPQQGAQLMLSFFNVLSWERALVKSGHNITMLIIVFDNH